MARKLNPAVKNYLLVYNVVLTLGWFYVGYLGLQSGNDPAKLWKNTEMPLKISQTAAIMEVVHAILGFTPTSFLTVAFQVASRIATVWGVVDLAPSAQESYGIPLFLICWVITEVIRYGYYALNLLGAGNIIVWFRYTLFVVLYPMGSTGEAWALIDALPYLREHNVWSITLPNAWNVTFSYHIFLIGGLLLYTIVLFPKLYMHMFSQRRKVLGRGASQARSHSE